jgi:glycosyltransferase involved in cell wall biosynthesis
LQVNDGQVDVSLVVPVYNAAPTLTTLWWRIVCAMDAAGQDYEVIFVDDASDDASSKILQGLAAQHDRIRLFAHTRNSGQAAAVLTGIAHMRGSIVVTLDDDLQHRPEDISILLQRLAAADERTLVMAVPLARLRPWWRDAVSLMANLFSNVLLERPLPLRLTAFCAFHKNLAAALVERGAKRDAARIATLVQVAERTITVPVQIDPSGLHRSRYGLRALWAIFLPRTRLFSLRRMIALAVAAILVAGVIAGTGAWLGGASLVGFLPFAAIATAITTITAALAWATIVQRRRAAQDDGAPLRVSPAAEDAVRSRRRR